ncbi:phospholipase A2 [Osmia lignaria lignaria]|uniref:phospholipase A2 n=1 Tax=Osmia lignaria lignaria TaxID=1437193 RepID=UPI00402B9FF5
MLLPRLSTILVLCLCLDDYVHAWSMYLSDANRIGSNNLPEVTERIDLIYPGTLWCGSGSKASNPNELGTYNETDACCRDHDMCPDVIEAFQSKHGLTNTAFYTRLDCACDEKFYDCLSKSEDGIGHKIGYIYFTRLGTRCFREDYPIVECKRETGIFMKTCLEYELDTSQPKEYQWFDVPPFD